VTLRKEFKEKHMGIPIFERNDRATSEKGK